MIVVHELPPNYEEIEKAFPLAKAHKAIFTFGNKIYAPWVTGEIPAPLIIHERTHCRQQGFLPGRWWKKYIQDVEFRMKQELEAHRAEYGVYSRYGRNVRRAMLRNVAVKLASPMYGSMMKVEEARGLIAV